MVATNADAARHATGRRPTPELAVAAALVVLSALASAAGSGSLLLAVAALLSPGLALGGLLPPALRDDVLARRVAAPALGMAATSVALISLTQLGLPLTGVTIHAVLALLLAAGWLVGPGAGAGEDEAAQPDRRAQLVDVLLLGAILAATVVLGWRVVGEVPLPGNDWAKYLLYAHEIAHHHKLLLDSPYWLGGVPFREDPGVPAIEGPALILSGAPASALIQGILLLAVLIVTTTWAALRATVGRTAGHVAAAFLAVVPSSQNILGWHGLANEGAFVLLALALAGLGAWASGRLDHRGEAGLALVLVAIAAAHRLTFATTIGAAGLLGLLVLIAPGIRTRGEVLRSALRILGALVVLGLLVALDLRARSSTAGGTMPYTAYLDTKVQLDLVLRDVTWPLAVLSVGGLLVLGALRQLPRAVWPAAALGVVVTALGYVWVVHLPLYYARMVFFLPLALAPVAGVTAAVLLRAARRREPAIQRHAGTGVLAATALAVAVLLAAGSWTQAERVREFYAFANPASLRGLDALDASLRPGEPVATDRCWSFLSSWLLSHPTYPALADQDIGPRAELPLAQLGRSIINGSAAGEATAERLGIRYALMDPTCPQTAGDSHPRGKVLFGSDRLAIVQLRGTSDR